MLKSLDISGFKSFAKKSTLHFTSPVTAIVGPNGSGKSNVVEAIRFVLGEQSMKSLRGKSGGDLIFKGSKIIGKLSRAVVAITFDNTRRQFTDGALADGLKLDFDEITIAREVFADGSSTYSINGSEVRLKDVFEILSRVNIGASGHHIISQGEADRVLSASARDRRAMVEDALGLKVYQYRLKESERKLEKSRLNMKEVTLLRREIAPHIVFLRKQVEKIEKAESMRQELLGLYHVYFKNQEHLLGENKKTTYQEHVEITRLIEEIDQKLSHEVNTAHEKGESEDEKAKSELLRKMSDIRSVIDELSRKVGRVEGMIEIQSKRHAHPAHIPKETVVFNRHELSSIVEHICKLVDDAGDHSNLDEVRPLLFKIKDIALRLSPKEEDTHTVQEEINQDELDELTRTKEQLVLEMENLRLEIARHQNDINELDQKIEEDRKHDKERDKSRFDLMMQKNDLTNKLSLVEMRKDTVEREYELFMNDISEASALLGPSVLGYKQMQIDTTLVDRSIQDEHRRKIERIKIKLEDAGAIGGADIMKEYQEVTERDAFLSREIEDITASISSLETLIRELKQTLDTEFKAGIEKINHQFQTFFSLMFGGGTAFLTLVAEAKRKKTKGEEEGDEEKVVSDVDEKEEFEHGIEINISLPQKKVKELSMLSGGERSLTSIALLFAISQVNPPPFLVLDETDAALDESNSRKYGDMIERLSEYSQLLVVTHNRETMSRAGVLYGVTVGADGGSKLLSIKFDEAVAVAK